MPWALAELETALETGERILAKHCLMDVDFQSIEAAIAIATHSQAEKQQR